MTACIAWYISNKFVYSISLSTNPPDKRPLLKTSGIEYFYLFQIVANENPTLGVVQKPLSVDSSNKFAPFGINCQSVVSQILSAIKFV